MYAEREARGDFCPQKAKMPLRLLLDVVLFTIKCKPYFYKVHNRETKVQN